MKEHRRPPSYGIIGLIALAGIMAFAAISIYTLRQGRKERSLLCLVLYAQVSRPTIGQKGTPGYAYYKAHPDELAVARRQNQVLKDSLPCGPGK